MILQFSDQDQESGDEHFQGLQEHGKVEIDLDQQQGEGGDLASTVGLEVVQGVGDVLFDQRFNIELEAGK